MAALKLNQELQAELLQMKANDLETRRAAVGLPPMAENTRSLQDRVALEAKVQKAAKDNSA